MPSTHHEKVGLDLRQGRTKLFRTREVPAGVAISTHLNVILSVYSSQTVNSMSESREPVIAHYIMSLLTLAEQSSWAFIALKPLHLGCGRKTSSKSRQPGASEPLASQYINLPLQSMLIYNAKYSAASWYASVAFVNPYLPDFSPIVF